MFILLAHYLIEMYEDCEITFFQFTENKLEDDIKSVVVESYKDMLEKAKIHNMDIVVFNSKNVDKFLLDYAENLKVNLVAWAHNYPSAYQANIMADCQTVKRLVFVGKQEYDKYIDHRIINKSTYIFNMINPDLPEYFRNNKFKNTVVYIGSLTPTKGFHILAKYWKTILKEVPDATLEVIGEEIYIARIKN